MGKTTLVNSLLKILLARAVAIALSAPTGRAAKRLSESTGLDTKTIHRLLETDPRTGTFRRNEETPLVVGAFRRLAHHFVDLVSIWPDHNAPSIGPYTVEDDRRGLYRPSCRRAGVQHSAEREV